jgi:hypothetical protein
MSEQYAASRTLSVIGCYWLWVLMHQLIHIRFSKQYSLSSIETEKQAGRKIFTPQMLPAMKRMNRPLTWRAWWNVSANI